jgi:hypothetical protein
MPRQTYRCPVHGDFEVSVPFSEEVLHTALCPHRIDYHTSKTETDCCLVSPWQPPTGVAFKIK